MSARKRASLAVLVGIALGLLFRAPANNETKSQGEVSETVAEVRPIFDHVLAGERQGLALAIYHDGKLIVDLWGGYAEREAARLWERDTMSVAFSATKTVGAFAFAILASRRLLSYDDLVIKHWPAFGQNGKENITIQWIIEHKAGLIKFDEELPLEQGNNHTHISLLIEQARPMWSPGTATGYHALTFGWLVDQIVRRVDPLQRGVGDFYRNEIRPLMKEPEFYIGLPRNLHHRVARLAQPSILEVVKVFTTTWHFIRFMWRCLMGHRLMFTSGDYPKWLSVVRVDMPYNDPAVREIENIASNGIGTARGLASVADAVMRKNLISDEVWNAVGRPTEFVSDTIAHFDTYRGHGFFYEPHPTRKNAFVICHVGHGMQKVIFDPSTKISIALLRNGLSFDPALNEHTDRIAQIVFNKIDARR